MCPYLLSLKVGSLRYGTHVTPHDGRAKSSGACIVKLGHNIVRSHIDCSYSYI